MPNKKILFLCTGNFFRSRFCEEVFNWHARKTGLGWEAFSAGLAMERGSLNVGTMSEHTVKGLKNRGIEPARSNSLPKKAVNEDFAEAEIVIALKEEEHKPLVEQRYPAWSSKVHYWDVSDVCGGPDGHLLEDMEKNVLAIICKLTAIPCPNTMV